MSAIEFISRFTSGKIPEHIERPIYEASKHNSTTASLYLNSKYATPEGASVIKNNPNTASQYYASKFVSDNDLTELLSNPDHRYSSRYASVLSAVDTHYNNMSPKHLSLLQKFDDPDLRAYAVYAKNANEQHLTTAMNDPDPNVRLYAMNNIKCNPSHIEMGLSDSNLSVKMAAVSHPNITKEQLNKVIADGEFLAILAKQNPKYKEYFPNGHENLNHIRNKSE